MTMAAAVMHGDSRSEAGLRYIPGLEDLRDESSALTQRQQKEHERIIAGLEEEYRLQKDLQRSKSVVRLREQFVHVHGTQGRERAVDVVMAIKAAEMARHGMAVTILNLNFQKRLETRALFVFLKDILMREDEMGQALVRLKIQEEDADGRDRQTMLDIFKDVSEDTPLFVISDETCKEPERMDDAVGVLIQPSSRFHFWTSSAFSHGTPNAARRHRMSAVDTCPVNIKQVMDMIDLEDDDVDITRPHYLPLRPAHSLPKVKEEELNIRQNLHQLPVKLISHSKKHPEPDVWECELCGKLLTDYLADQIGLGKPGLEHNEVFIVGSIQRFESSVSISGLQVSLLDRDIVCEVLFCRRAVRIQDILKTMNKVVVSDSISMRGIDKKIVIVIPSPREREQQEEIEKEMKEAEKEKARIRREEEEVRRKKRREEREVMARERRQMEAETGFRKPVAINRDDETVLYRRAALPGDRPDGADEYAYTEEESVADLEMKEIEKMIAGMKPEEEEPKRKKRRDEEPENTRARERAELEAETDFWKPVAIDRDDETVLYRRVALPGDEPDDADEYANTEKPVPDNNKRRKKGLFKEAGVDDESDEEFLSDDPFSTSEDSDDVEWNPEPRPMDWQQLVFNSSYHQSLLRRSINSLSRSDKDMVLDLFTDAPQHAVLFHFAEDEYQIEPEEEE